MEIPPAAEPKRSGRWSVDGEIDWGTIDSGAARADADVLMLVRRAALRAARRTVGLSHLLSALAAESLASALLARELHDSWKHFHALRSYLEVAEFTPAITEAELEQHRRTAPDRELRRREEAAARIAMLVDDAARDGAVFGLISSRANDPVLARLADRIAADRRSHSLALAKYLSGSSTSACGKTA